jgi:uncharacterized DUF497 family protein
MEIEFDPAKDQSNIAKHGISLARGAELEIIAFVEDDRNAYGEVRYRAWGWLDGKYHYMAFTSRNGVMRAISLRRAHRKEIDCYVPQASRR